MKKSLTVLGTMGVLSMAHAQSTVSITGTMDLYGQRAMGSLTRQYLVSSGGNSTSKLTFRANEDLGGGLNAGFWLESGIGADTGSGQATNTNNQTSGATTGAGLTWNRRSIVYLKGAWGEVHLGRDWSPIYDTFTSRFDVFGVGSGIGLNYTASINRDAVRVSNAVGYTTPKFAGLAANLQAWRGENVGGTGGSADGNGHGLRLHYDNGPFGSVASYARTKFATGDAVFKNVAAIYDFGMFRLTANYMRAERGTLEQKGGLLGIVWPVGPGEIKGSYSTFSTNAAGEPKGQKFAVGYVHNLSKRTALYTTLAQIRNSNGSALAIAGSTTAPNENSTGFDLGIRHSF